MRKAKLHPAAVFTLGLVALAILAIGAWWALRALGAFILSLNSDVGKAFVAAAVAVVGSVLSLALTKAYESRLAVRRDLRIRKEPVYEKIVSTLFALFLADKLGQPKPAQLDWLKFFAETTEKLTIWGSDEVVLAFKAIKSETDPINIMWRVESFIFAIRKDLGHYNKGVEQGTILGLFINDIQNYQPPS